MVRWPAVVTGLLVGWLALAEFVLAGTYPSPLGPVPPPVMRGLVAGALASLAVGAVVVGSVALSATWMLATAG